MTTWSFRNESMTGNSCWRLYGRHVPRSKLQHLLAINRATRPAIPARATSQILCVVRATLSQAQSRPLIDSTMRTARTSGRDGGIWHSICGPWLRPLDMRAETNLPGITYLGICSWTAQGKQASDTECIGSDTNPPNLASVTTLTHCPLRAVGSWQDYRSPLCN